MRRFYLFSLTFVILFGPLFLVACNNDAPEDINIPAPMAETPITVAPETEPANSPTSLPSTSADTTTDTSTPTAADADKLFPHTADGVLFGYVNVAGEFVIEPRFRQAFPFVEGLAVVMLEDKFGFIDSQGQFVIEPQFDFANSFTDSLASVSLPGDPEPEKFGYIDQTGQMVIEPQFDFPSIFSEGLAVVSRGEVDDFKQGVIDTSGAFVIEPQFATISPFFEGLAVFNQGDLAGYLDSTGQVVIEPQFQFAGPFAEGLAAVSVDDKHGYIDHTGQFVIEPQFDFASDFSEGLAVINLDGQDGYIDQTGQIVIPPQFDRADLFFEGLAGVQLDGLAGYIDQTGHMIIEPQFQTAGPFEDGIAQVTQGDSILFIDRAGQVLSKLANPFVGETPVAGEPSPAQSSTLIFDFMPFGPEESRDGSCFTNSLSVPQPSAWRCTVGNEIFDPCLIAEDGQTLVCDADPTRSPGFVLNLTEPLPPPDITTDQSQPGQPWLFELASGAICTFSTGATAVVDDKRLNYFCSDDSQILGELQPGDPWTAEKVVLDIGDEGASIVESETLEVTAIWRTVSPTALAEEIGLSPEQVQVTAPSINRIQGYYRPALPYNPAIPLALNGYPAHLRFSFDDDVLSPWFDPLFERQLLIFPVPAYRQIYEAVGINEVTTQIETLNQLLTSRPEAVEQAIPVFPPLGETEQDLRAQVKYLDFAGGSGVRFITHFAQEASPITNDTIFYTFQGLTADGRFYIAFYQPVSTSTLPNTFEDSVAAADYEAFAASFDSYLAETVQSLNALPATDYTPDLSQLDTLIESLRLGN
jgi:hypothetical protein